jgi:DtxR family transcriptional regulator, Mn-dependent transcriptional regulator
MSLTPRDYDCLSAMKHLTADGWAARLKDVAAEMGVKPPTAIGFLERLIMASAVEKGAGGYRLTKEGLNLSNELTRSHRLFETLFVRTGIPIDEAHRISSSIDRYVDGRALAVLCARLDHPKKCPHNMPIPAGDKYD